MEWAILGAIRFVLALAVFGAHLRDFADPSPLILLYELSAMAAVIGFLVISGYSIAHSLERSTGGFYWRRAVRILPVYALAIATAYGLGLVPGFAAWAHANHPAASWSEVLANALFLQAIFTIPLPNNDVVWTLAIEVVFYAAAPLLRRLPSAALLAMMAASITAFVLYERTHQPYFTISRFGFNFIVLGWPWLLGFWFYFHRDRAAAKIATLVIPLVVVALGESFSFQGAWPVTLLLTSAAVVYGRRFSLNRWASRTFDRLGDISYPLYIVHLPVLTVMRDGFGIGSAAVLTASALASAWIVDRYYDRPLKALLKSFRRPGPGRADPAPVELGHRAVGGH